MHSCSLGGSSVSIATNRKQPPAGSLGGCELSGGLVLCGASCGGVLRPVEATPKCESLYWRSFSPVSSSPAKISEGRPFSTALSRRSATCSGAIILHKCFSSLLGKLPLRLYHNILLLWCNFHRQAGKKGKEKVDRI